MPLLDEDTQLTIDWASPAERKRISAQSARILARLQQGRVTNGELSVIAIRYSARIFELKQAGYQIDIVERDHGTGVTVYELRGER